jgi:hypothetical protein
MDGGTVSAQRTRRTEKPLKHRANDGFLSNSYRAQPAEPAAYGTAQSD